MIGCLRTRVRKQPNIAPYFEAEIVLQFYNLEAWTMIAESVTIILACENCYFNNLLPGPALNIIVVSETPDKINEGLDGV